MKKHSLVTAASFILLSLSLTQGAMLLDGLYSRAVKTGENVSTRVDSVTMDMRVNSGVAVSKYTFVVTPVSYANIKVIPVVDTFMINGGAVVERVIVPPLQVIDSIEISLSFTLPTDFVADSMWLWVDGKPVEANIQDRALASAQYQQIVGTRRDPALLETWGNGSYNLRIFPAKLHASRKISIQFHHVFDDGEPYGSKGLAAAVIPIGYNGGAAIYDATTDTYKPSAITSVQARFTAEDNNSYTAKVPGVGEGIFSRSTSLVLSSTKVAKIDTGMVTTADPSGENELLWTAIDPKSELMSSGTTVDFTTNTLRFDDESDTRILLLDMRNILWNWGDYYALQSAGYGTTSAVTKQLDANIWGRAQKCAVLSLQQYLKENHKFNVLIGGKTITAAFSEPVAATPNNIQTAITAIMNAVPSSGTSTTELIKAAIEQSPRAITILISDLFSPAQYRVKSGTSTEISPAGKQYDAQIAEIRKEVAGSELTLFTVNDDWQVSQIALMTGGFNLSGIIRQYTLAYNYEVIDGIRVQLPVLPALFGNNNGSGLRHLSVTAKELEDLVYSIDNTYRGILYADDIRITPIALAKSQMVVAPGYYSTALTTGRMHIAGRTTIENSGKPVTVTIKGKLDGLWFSSTFTASGSYLPIISSFRPLASPQWAYRTTEKLAFDDYVGNASRIKALGKEYHIVTRQTSLLALEPGMKLWEDTAWQTAENKNVIVPGASAREIAVGDQAVLTTADGMVYSTSGSGFNIDGITLENLLRKNGMPVANEIPKPSRALSVTAQGNLIYVTMPSIQVPFGVTLKLFDMKGRVVATHQLSMSDFHGTKALWNLSKHSSRLSRGIYSVQISGGTVKKNFRITLIGK